MRRPILPDVFSGTDPGVDSPAVHRIQPVPETLIVCHAGTFTAIARGWRDGDVARCRLCPRSVCQATNNTCLVVTPQHVPNEDAALYSFQASRETPRKPRLWQRGGSR